MLIRKAERIHDLSNLGAGTLAFILTPVRCGEKKNRSVNLGFPPRLQALISFVRALQLNGVLPHFLGLPSTYVTDLPVRIVIPALTGNWIGDRLTQFVGAGRSQRIDGREAAGASGATRVRHCSIEKLTRYVVVTRGRSALHSRDPA